MMKLPLGTWPADQKLKEIGAFFTLAAETGFEALGTAYLTRVLGMEVEDVNDLLREIKKEIKNRKIHAYGRQ
jgi:deoxyxylulose-5-phosphate synthase